MRTPTVLLALTLAVCCCLSAAAGLPGQTMTFYAAPDGDPIQSGLNPSIDPADKDGPTTVLAALERVRAMRHNGELQGPAVILLREGTYLTPITLTPEDSGTTQAPLTIAAYPGENPVISAGMRVTGWREENGLWKTVLPETPALDGAPHAMWVDGVFHNAARDPDTGFHVTQGVPLLEDGSKSKTGFNYQDGTIVPWADMANAIVVTWHAWDVSYGRIASIDETKREVQFKSPDLWPFEHWGPNQRYFVENTLSALDKPGEWCFDAATRTLTYMPEPGQTMDGTVIIVPAARQALMLQGDLAAGRFIEHVTFDGLAFRHGDHPISEGGFPSFQAAFHASATVEARGARDCKFVNCEISQTGNHAIWLHEGCRGNLIQRCHLHDLGAGGVRIGEGASPTDENGVCGWNTVDNNWIHDGGKTWPSGVGVMVGRSSFNKVSHNEISDFYYTGVSVGWSWGYAPSSANNNIVEFNHIHNLGKRILSDMGGIYCLGAAPGTVLRNNKIHDIYAQTYGGWGIYPDEGSTHLLIENNLVYNVKTGGFHQHYGRENVVRNNIFAFSEEMQFQRTREEEHLSFLFTQNIVYYNNGNLTGGAWTNNHFIMDRNCYWDTSGIDMFFGGEGIDAWRARGHDVNSLVADPLFVDAEAFDFELRPESPVIALGFVPFDASLAGLYGDIAWTDAPLAIPRDTTPLPIVQDVALHDGFEDASAGDPPADATVYGETAEARIRVTEEVSREGDKCLKITDAVGLDQVYNPHMFYNLRARNGIARASFDIRLESGAMLYHEWRSSGNPYKTGPSLYFSSEGVLKINNEDKTAFSPSKWLHIEITCPVGTKADGSYTVSIKPENGEKQEWTGLPYTSADFRYAEWVGFVANEDKAGIIYLDNIKYDVE